MDKLKIVTNFVPRPIIWGFELSESERAEFDYYTDDEIESQTFFRYKDSVYDLGEFSQTDHFGEFWHMYISDSFFSGILVHFPIDDDESIVVGWYYG